ncbi:hypothetical protein [Roseimaritima multifibrata]|nr:hypothetical protein [Roseimaritima multifibrata]
MSISLATMMPFTHREGRIEPRANKRRPKVLKLLAIPRAAYQAQLVVTV